MPAVLSFLKGIPMNRFLICIVFSVAALFATATSYAQRSNEMNVDLGATDLSVNVDMAALEFNVEIEFAIPFTDRALVVSVGTSGLIIAPIAPENDDKMFIRYGSPDSKEKLASDAAAAEANEKVGIHGVSVIFRKPPTKGDPFGQTTKKKIEDAGFTITQTGKNKSHYTVTLPKPVTQELATDSMRCSQLLLHRKRIRPCVFVAENLIVLLPEMFRLS